MTEAAAKARPTTLDHLRSKKKAPTSKVTLCLDQELADAFYAARDSHDFAVSLLDEAKKADVDADATKAQVEVAKTAEALDAARAAADAVSQTFRFKAIGRDRYEALLTEYGATDETRAKQTAEGQQVTDYDVHAFPQALIAASLVDPALSHEDVLALWDDPDWTSAELSILWSYALSINGQSRVVDLGKGSGSTQP